MGAIKNFFHEEICMMQEGEDILIDDAYIYSKWQEHENAKVNKQIEEFEETKRVVAESGVPGFLKS
jgi:hypothetical protein